MESTMGWTREQERRLHELERRWASSQRLKGALLALKRYDPSQPRHPAGSSEGGRWAGAGDAGTHAETTIDRTGARSWERVITRRDADGRIVRQTVYNHDRSHIVTRYDPGVELSSVTPAGGRTTSFATSGPVQIVRDGLTGSVLSASEFRPGEREPLVQVAQAGALARGQQGLAAAGLLDRYNRDRLGFESEDDVPVLLRSPMAHRGEGVLYQARNATLEEVRAMCPRFDRTQRIVDEEAASMRGRYSDPAEYGRVLHARVAYRINAEGNPAYSAEVTRLGGVDARLNTLGSSRADVFDYNPDRGLLCIYDIKTGRDGFSGASMERQARNFLRERVGIHWVLTAQIRPGIHRW
jgi:hypothetical protein